MDNIEPKNIDERMVIEVTRDKMNAIISFEEPVGAGTKVDENMIRRFLDERGVMFGVDEELLKSIAVERKYHYKYIIARGEYPVKGEDSYLTFHFDKDKLNEFKPKENPDGTVDLKNLNIVTNVEEGAVLVVKTPSVPGKEGVNVQGESVKAPRLQEVRMPQGKNTKLLEDGVTLVAGISGKLCYEGHNVYLAPTFIVEKDVDISTGNIQFVGDVIVNGSVKDGFSVEAGGSIEIRGSVEGAYIHAQKDILISYGIQGMEKGHITTKGNVIAKFIQNAKVEAGGDIITEAIMHSNVAATNIDANKGKGLIVGGHIIASHRILANTIGSAMATQTEIQIGISPEVLRNQKLIEEKYEKATSDLQKITQSIAFLRGKQDAMTQEKQEMLAKLLRTKIEAEASYKLISTEYMDTLQKIRDVQEGSIKVKNKLNPGVKVKIGTAIKYISEDYTYCTIEKQGADVVIGTY